MKASTAAKAKPWRGMGMEGPIASWYAKTTASSLPEFRALAERVDQAIAPSAGVLEVAPGPGYFAVELARLAPRRIVGLDVSHSFVRIARETAAQAGVTVEFRRGDAAAMPFEATSFDFVLCRAAFKNFSDPVGSMAEMHRVLRPGGAAWIIDMRRDATDASIAEEVGKMRLGAAAALMTSVTLKALKKRAYSREDFQAMARESPFGGADIYAAPLGFEVRLTKAA